MSGKNGHATNGTARCPPNQDCESDAPPLGWSEATIGDFTPPGGLFDGPFGSSLKTADYTDRGIRVVRLENISNLRFVDDRAVYIAQHKYNLLEKHTVGEGDLLVGSFVDGQVRVCLVPKLATLSIAKADCFCVRPDVRVIDKRYLMYFLGSEKTREAFIDHIHGATRPRITTKQLRQLTVQIPPLAEQQRIAAALDAVLAKVASCQARLANIPTLLKRFRQAVLAAACSGRLTADWRQAFEEHRQLDLEELAASTHRRAWESKQLAKIEANGKLPKNEKWRSAYEPPRFAPIDERPELPTGWSWVRLGLLGQDPLMTVQTGPFGAQLHNDEFTDAGVPVIAVGNLTGMGFTRENLYFVPPKKAQQLSRYDVNAGDVLFARSGATLGKVCVAPEYVDDWRMTGHILRVRLNSSIVLPEIVVYALHGDPSVQDQVYGSIRGITRPGFNTTLLESIAVPLAPLAEQQEIVRRVDALFAVADKIEARYELARRHVDRLARSVLAKAFRGELVPTEHALAAAEGRDYEPAAELLNRIRAAQPPGSPKPCRPRQRSSGAKS